MAKKSTALISLKDLEKAMAVEAQVAAAAEPVGGVAAINTRKKGKFIFNETALPNPLEVVVIAQVFQNALYEDAYDADAQSSPVCSAVALNENDLRPDPKGPKKMAVESCAVCPNNAFGSAESGRGKACRNGRRLAVVLLDSLEKVPDPSHAVLNISPAGLGAWSKYVKGLARLHNRPPHGVVTRFSFDEEQNSPVVVPISCDVINDVALLTKIKKKRDQVIEAGELARPFDMTPRADRPAKKAKAAPKKKAKARF